MQFSVKTCMPCPSYDLCISSMRKYKRRTVTVRARGHYPVLEAALEAASGREKEPKFAATFARRVGVEVSVSRADRTAVCADRGT
jgi:hypothetical protein